MKRQSVQTYVANFVVETTSARVIRKHVRRVERTLWWGRLWECKYVPVGVDGNGDVAGLHKSHQSRVAALYKPADRLDFAKKTLKWIKARKNKDGTNKFVILFTDEAWMGAKDVKKRQWVSNHTKEILTRRMERWAPKVHSWGALWDGDVYVTDLPLAGKGPRKGLSGADFLKHFKVHMTACLARVRKQFPRKEIVVVMDGAGVHNTAKEWLRQKKIGLVEPWPAHSPDLNPIENGWSYMKRRMGLAVQLFKNTKANRQKIRELRSEVVEALDPKVCSSLALSFERRLERVVELGGEYTGY